LPVVRVAVVLPTYDEVDNIGIVVPALLALPQAPTVLVVDDGSPDGTAGRVRELMATAPGLQLLERPGKQGLGAAYVAAFTRLLAGDEFDVVVQMDADLSHDPADVPRLLDTLAAADLAIGSRYVAGGAVDGWPVSRRALSRLGNVYARAWLGPHVNDLTGGFKAWRAELLRRIDPATIRSDGYAFQIELTKRAISLDARVVEVPITFHNRTRGQSKMDARIALEALWRVPTLRRH
jgi:dolichol-phosphate mannosyltransferase